MMGNCSKTPQSDRYSKHAQEFVKHLSLVVTRQELYVSELRETLSLIDGNINARSKMLVARCS